MLAALGMGLLISGFARNQFVAGQIAIITTFLPAFILSGFVFDINSMPRAVQIITHIVAARYFVAILQSVFLAGNVWSVILPNAARARRDGGDLPRPRAGDRAQAAGLSRMLGQVLALIVKETACGAARREKPHGADRAAADPAAGVRLRRHLRSQPRADGDLRPGPSRGLARSGGPLRRRTHLPSGGDAAQSAPDQRADRFAPGADWCW